MQHLAFSQQWYDYRLRWNSTEFDGVTQIDFVSDELWRPDVGLMNGKHSHYFDFSADQHSRINIDYEGRITWLYGAVLDVACPLDFADFPFDTQVCHLIITPWQSSMRQLKLLPMQHGPAVDNYFLPNSNVSEWEIQSIKFELEHYRSQFGVNYQYINISIQLRRQPLYFIILVLVPFLMLSILACLIFTLDDTGDRLSVALSLILSMTMYVVIVSSNAPRSMRTVPLLGIFLLDQLGLLCIATVIAVLSNKLHQYQGEIGDQMEMLFMTPPAPTKPRGYDNSHALRSPLASDSLLSTPPDAQPCSSQSGSPIPQIGRNSSSSGHVLYTVRNIHAQPHTSSNAFPLPVDCIDPSGDDVSCAQSIRGTRLANIAQYSPIFMSRPYSLPIRSSFIGNRWTGQTQPQPNRVIQAHFATPTDNTDRRFLRKLYNLGRRLFHPKAVELRRDVAAGIDNMGIIIYLLATVTNAVLCLIIMPGRER
ncbi:unnamed protein product [Echinostoma caproni]|uniref:Neur_chan_LBD domain-containing protein n=1 Tax=Echinostoma caproni TaxID=27848 RepID=A0A183ABC4_9TREM|nr:unnamed protein product [Echinostoma caproni]